MMLLMHSHKQPLLSRLLTFTNSSCFQRISLGWCANKAYELNVNRSDFNLSFHNFNILLVLHNSLSLFLCSFFAFLFVLWLFFLSLFVFCFSFLALFFRLCFFLAVFRSLFLSFHLYLYLYVCPLLFLSFCCRSFFSLILSLFLSFLDPALFCAFVCFCVSLCF